MSCVTKHIFNSLSMATNSSCLVSLPSRSYSSATATSCNRTLISHSYLALPSKPIYFQLSCSHSYSPSSAFLNSFLSIKKKRASRFSCLVSILDIKQEEDGGEEEEEGFKPGFEFEGNELSEGEYDDGGDVTEGEVEEEVEGEGEYQEPSEDAKLFVGNLPYDIDSEKLAQLFEQVGVVEIAEIIYNRETDRSRGFGFVTMSTMEQAEQAMEKFDRYELNGRLLTVNKASARGERPERAAYQPLYRIFVGSLPWDVDDVRLEQVFSEHGKVVSARVVYDRDTGRSRGFGFVTMASEAEMNDAIANLDGQSLDGRAIRVNIAQAKPRRSF